MAIEDAMCLSERFSRLAPNLTLACLEYERLRFERTCRIQTVAREMGRLNHLSGEAARARDAVLAGRDPDDHEGNAWIFDGPQAAVTAAPTNFFGRHAEDLIDRP
jgi:2-polyprenyl-6-methoxyphenol hydroxylase-like FAD-dependent oxidoreductase